MAIRWGLSILDWRSHAVNEWGDHPIGVYVAECGHLLMVVTTLHDRPNGKPCEACAAQQFARAVKDDDPDQIRADSAAPDERRPCRLRPISSTVVERWSAAMGPKQSA